MLVLFSVPRRLFLSAQKGLTRSRMCRYPTLWSPPFYKGACITHDSSYNDNMYFGGFNAVHNMMCIETSFIIARTSFFFNDVFGEDGIMASSGSTCKFSTILAHFFARTTLALLHIALAMRRTLSLFGRKTCANHNPSLPRRYGGHWKSTEFRMKENFSINMLLFCKNSNTIYCVFFIRNIEQKDFFSDLSVRGRGTA